MITQARLKQLLDYDPATGVFVWKVSRRGHRAGAVAGTKRPDGYNQIRIDGSVYYAHRLAWLYITGKWPTEQIDHRNRTPADNRFINLREASPSENARNSSKPAANTSGHKGVYRDVTCGKWRAQIMVDGVRVHLGLFDLLEEAAAAYAEASAQHHKEFGRVV